MQVALKLFVLPAYSPQLNPDVWVWKNIKHDRVGAHQRHRPVAIPVVQRADRVGRPSAARGPRLPSPTGAATIRGGRSKGRAWCRRTAWPALPHTPGRNKCSAAWCESQPSGEVGLRRVVDRGVGRPTAAGPMIVPVVLAV